MLFINFFGLLSLGRPYGPGDFRSALKRGVWTPTAGVKTLNLIGGIAGATQGFYFEIFPGKIGKITLGEFCANFEIRTFEALKWCKWIKWISTVIETELIFWTHGFWCVAGIRLQIWKSSWGPSDSDRGYIRRVFGNQDYISIKGSQSWKSD